MNCTISVCAGKDLNTWKHAAPRILEYIDSTRYLLIVPSVSQFLPYSDGFEVIDERDFMGFGKEYIRSARAGWYYQQLLKIQGLLQGDTCLIWDADTIPIRPLEFEADNHLVFYKGRECHSGYFEALDRLLGIPKCVAFSFIAQCLPYRRAWAWDFIRRVEQKHSRPWFDAILGCIDLTQASGFSEYETLGTFAFHNYPDECAVTDRDWERYGARKYAIGDLPADCHFDFVSFESWDV